MDEARKVYDKLLKNYPNSKYVPEAHLAFADYFFEGRKYANAESSRYQMVLKFPKSSAYWYAKYKMGWIHLNLQRFQLAQGLRGRPGDAERQAGDPEPLVEEGLRPRLRRDR